MKRAVLGRPRPAAWLSGPAAVLPTIAGCSEGVLAPASSEAELIAGIGWVMFILAGVVMALVIALVGWAILRARRTPEQRGGGTVLVVMGGIVLPAVVLPVIWLLSLPAMGEIAGADEPIDLEVEIIGYQWRYEVRYPEAGVFVLDELHLPLDERALIRVSSADVIHSFWIPELGGKRDMLPGKVTELTVRPTRAAVYGARCAEFCGIGHTTMTMRVVVEPRADFDAWLEAQRSAAGRSDGSPVPPEPSG